MPDISMCNSDECPLRKECYRHECKPSQFLQAFMNFYRAGEKCDYFSPVEATK